MKKLLIISLLIFGGFAQDCDENMYWSDCGLPFYCNPTCFNPEPLSECDDYCETGCFCNEGYIYSDDTYSECILLDDCEELLICDGFIITDFYTIDSTEFGNQLFINISIPQIELYAPNFVLQEEDEFISIIDSIVSYFWVTGPTIIDLYYLYEYEYLPDNHLFHGNINIATEDNTLSCNLAFSEILGNGLLGDLNNDNQVNIIDVIYLANTILDGEFNNISDLNNDGQINIIDIVNLINLILNPSNEDCFIIPEIGDCDGICPTYYFNQNINECEEFITGCCGIEAFDTMQDCIDF